jgi:hypothetical protein
MAISGGAMSSIQLNWRDGKLVEGAVMSRQGNVVCDNLKEAETRLRAGETVFLKLYGHNLAEIGKAFEIKADEPFPGYTYLSDRCPFCEERLVIMPSRPPEQADWRFSIGCDNCETETDAHPTREEALARWRTRMGTPQ